MEIREAVPEDNEELQHVQSQCPQGKTITGLSINTPDFFARAKAFESYKIYVALDKNQIIGSGACVVRDAYVGGEITRVGYIFQAFVGPTHRRKGVASALLHKREEYLAQQGAELIYTIIVKTNIPSIRYVERQGYVYNRILRLQAICAHKKKIIQHKGTIRSIKQEDMEATAQLLNNTWKGYDLHESTSAQNLARFVTNTPGYGLDNLFVLEDKGEILACMGFWDWSQIMRNSLEKLPWTVSTLINIVNIIGLIIPIPKLPCLGADMKCWCLTTIGFRKTQYLTPLFRYLNNLACKRGIFSMMCVGESNSQIFTGMKGMFCFSISDLLFVKSLKRKLPTNQPIYFDGIHL